jgi:hypothetical protein
MVRHVALHADRVRWGADFSNVVVKYRLRKTVVGVMPSRLPFPLTLAPASVGNVELA